MQTNILGCRKCKAINIGFINKGTKVENIKEIIRLGNEAGIINYCFLMAGVGWILRIPLYHKQAHNINIVRISHFQVYLLKHLIVL